DDAHADHGQREQDPAADAGAAQGRLVVVAEDGGVDHRHELVAEVPDREGHRQRHEVAELAAAARLCGHRHLAVRYGEAPVPGCISPVVTSTKLPLPGALRRLSESAISRPRASRSAAPGPLTRT